MMASKILMLCLVVLTMSSLVTSGSILASGSALSKMCSVNATGSLIKFNGEATFLPENVFNGNSVTVARDASTYERFMVLVVPIPFGPSKYLLRTHIKLKLNKIEIIPNTISGSTQIVIINSKIIRLPVAGKAAKITGIFENGDDGPLATTLLGTTDGVVIKAPRFGLEEVAINGTHLQIIPSLLVKNKVAGLCGSFQ